MLKEDLNVILYKILQYLKECAEKGESINLKFFTESNLLTNENQLNNAIYDAYKNDLIDGVQEVQMINSTLNHPMKITRDIRLTIKGYEYLENNSFMIKTKEFLEEIKK